MVPPTQSYIIASTPRSGSNLLADGLAQTNIAGKPCERFPRPSEHIHSEVATRRAALLAQPPPEDSYNEALDAEYIKRILELGTTENGVFGIKIHRFQIDDAVRRFRSYLGSLNSDHHEILSTAFPNLSYIWLRRRDKISQAVSWHKAVQSNQYVKLHDSAPSAEELNNEIEFDYTAIRTYWSALECSDKGWQYFFSTLKENPLTIWYEDLSEDYQSTIKGTLAYLKLDKQPFVVSPPRYRKTADLQSSEWVERFKSIHSRSHTT